MWSATTHLESSYDASASGNASEYFQPDKISDFCTIATSKYGFFNGAFKLPYEVFCVLTAWPFQMIELMLNGAKTSSVVADSISPAIATSF